MTRADLERVVQAALDSHYERAVVVQDCEMALARAVALAVLDELEKLGPYETVWEDIAACCADTRRELEKLP